MVLAMMLQAHYPGQELCPGLGFLGGPARVCHRKYEETLINRHKTNIRTCLEKKERLISAGQVPSLAPTDLQGSGACSVVIDDACVAAQPPLKLTPADGQLAFHGDGARDPPTGSQQGAHCGRF